MTQDDWRDGVLRRLDLVEQEQRLQGQRMALVEKHIAVSEVQLKAISEQQKQQTETMRWLVRLIVGSLVAAVVAFIINGGLTLVTP